MLKEVLLMGVREVSKLEPRSDTVIISILYQFEEHNRPHHLRLFKDHLILYFVDTFEKPGELEWPDQMSEEEHKVICKYDEEKAPELGEEVRLVVHCHGGGEPINLSVASNVDLLRVTARQSERP